MNTHEARARAVKVAALVDGALFCNDLLVAAPNNWPTCHAEGLRKLADLLDLDIDHTHSMWQIVAIPANVTTEPSARTRQLVTAALRARADEFDAAVDPDVFAGLTPTGF